MQAQVAQVARTSQQGWRQVRGALRGAPIIPVLICVVLAVSAIFGDYLIDVLPTTIADCKTCTGNPETYNPEAGNLREKHYPPMLFSAEVRGVHGDLRLSTGLGYLTDLDNKTISPELRQEFQNAKVALPADAEVEVTFPGGEWQIKNTPYIVVNENEQLNVYNRVLPGDRHHILGTDRLGRDVMARLIRGGRLSLLIAFVSIAISSVLGTILGLIAGYYGRWIDAVVMRLVDLSLAFPAILLALVFAVALGPNLWWVVLVLVLIRWSHFARLVRGETLALRERDFVALARVAGAPTHRIIAVHIFPNLVNSIVVLGTLHVGSAIIVEATLSFLGAGVPPPTPTWGEMIAGDRQFVRTAWWVSSAAGVAIALAVLSFNLLGDWLRDRLDPGLRTL
jgi:peptide/nickel transport system permease protein